MTVFPEPVRLQVVRIPSVPAASRPRPSGALRAALTRLPLQVKDRHQAQSQKIGHHRFLLQQMTHRSVDALR